MPEPHFHGSRASFSASKALDTIGRTVISIRENEHLTWKDVGRVFGKSEDRAASYATGMSEMGVTAFLLGCREWGGQFANPALAQVGMKLVPLETYDKTDWQGMTAVTRWLATFSQAIEDGEIDAEEFALLSPLAEEIARFLDRMQARGAEQKTIDVE